MKNLNVLIKNLNIAYENNKSDLFKLHKNITYVPYFEKYFL